MGSMYYYGYKFNYRKVNASKGEKMDVKKGSQGKTLFTMFGK